MAEKQKPYFMQWGKIEVRNMVGRTLINNLRDMRDIIRHANIDAPPTDYALACYNDIDVDAQNIIKSDLNGGDYSIRQIYKAYARWELVPFAITPTGDDIKQGHLRFSYRAKDNSGYAPKKSYPEILIASSFKGKIIRRHEVTGYSNHEKQIPSLVAPFNFILYERYFETLWRGCSLPEWHVPKDRHPCYMGLKRGDITEPHKMRTQEKKDFSALIDSDAGDAAIILLAYSALSMMRPLLKRYPHLKKDLTPSKQLEAFAKQIVLSVAPEVNHDEACETVTKLVALCCGTKIEGDLLESSIHTPGQKRRQANTISSPAYEHALEQGYSVLWVNRTPSAKQLSTQQILLISLAGEFPKPKAEDFFQRVFGHFADHLGGYAESEIYKDHLDPKIAARVEVQKLFEKLHARKDTGLDIEDDACMATQDEIGYCEAILYISRLRERAVQYIDAFEKAFDNTSDDCEDSDDAEESEGPLDDLVKKASNNLTELDERMDGDTKFMNFITSMEQERENDLEKEHGKKEHKQNVVAMKKKQTEVTAICSESERAINRLFSRSDAITRYFDDVYQEVYEEHFEEIAKELKEKACLLTAAFQIFVSVCRLHQTHIPRLVEAIERSWVPPQITPRQRVEQYLTKCIKDGACARMRGARCDLKKIKVWYNPKKAQFLIPSSTYIDKLFPDLSPRPTKQDACKTLGELLIPNENKRSGTLRWSNEVRVRRDGQKMSVLRVDATKLSKDFRCNTMVDTEMTTMEKDETPYKIIS